MIEHYSRPAVPYNIRYLSGLTLISDYTYINAIHITWLNKIVQLTTKVEKGGSKFAASISQCLFAMNSSI